MNNNFTIVRNSSGVAYTNSKKQSFTTKGDIVMLLDGSGAVVGIFSSEAEAEQAQPIIAYNLERGKVPARLLKVTPPHRQNNRQMSNKNQQYGRRSK